MAEMMSTAEEAQLFAGPVARGELALPSARRADGITLPALMDARDRVLRRRRVRRGLGPSPAPDDLPARRAEAEERARIFAPYQVNEAMMAATGKDSTIFLHCLPAERGRETTDGVLESEQSYIFQQAENRMHAQNAIMVYCLGAARP